MLIRWGDKVLSDAPAFDPHHHSAEAQSKQFGFNNDFTAYFPYMRSSDDSGHGLLCVNHEYADSYLMFDDISQQEALEKTSDEQQRINQQAVGASVIEIKKSGNRWQMVDGIYNRRITATTPMRISGPAAGHERMKTSADPTGKHVLGTLANCAGGVTPWGTYLTCEENFDGFFTLPDDTTEQRDHHQSYGIGINHFHRWDKVDPRFDVKQEPNEPNRFGWVVEIDPYDPQSTPIKRTALGRFKHESAAPIIAADGRVVVYSGDDENFQYLYRFVSRDVYDPTDRAHAMTLLNHGTLYAAKFQDDGSLNWLPLIHGEGPLTAENGFHSQAELLIDTRRAATLLDATPMDRPEDVEVNPVSSHVYLCLTNNRKRETGNSSNTRSPNLYGHILELKAPKLNGKRDHAADYFSWHVFLMAGDPDNPKHGAHYQGKVSEHGWLANPDNIAFNPYGDIFITTDGQPKSIGAADAVYAANTAGDGKGITRCFFRGPTGCEMTGPSFTPDGRTMFLSIQHPADDKGSTFSNPSTRWPDFDDDMPPRPAVITITKDDGGVIGS